MKVRQRVFPSASESPRLHRTIWYMGAKARVIPRFLETVLSEELSPGQTILDLMCGSGVVSAFCADRYRVFANDVQLYASEIARSLIEQEPASKSDFLESLDFELDLAPAYEANFEELAQVYAPALELEADLLRRFAADGGGKHWPAEYRTFLRLPGGIYPVGAANRGTPYRRAARLLGEHAIKSRRRNPRARPAMLVTAYYANVYFGLRQALQLDSLRAAIDSLDPEDRFYERRRCHYLSALLHSASVTTSGTSHFAQPRHLDKESELRAMAKRRLLDILAVFQEYSEEITATVRRTRHRQGNCVLNVDYRRLIDRRGRFHLPLESARSNRRRSPKIHLVYLDPPYTADHYSRFYHVLEVIASYDYPELERDQNGAVLRGRYPVLTRRFQSDFSRRSRVEEEFRRVIGAAAASGSRLVISYSAPTGLLLKRYASLDSSMSPLTRFERLCRESYRHVEILRRPMMHSGQGDSNLQIDELLVVCR